MRLKKYFYVLRPLLAIRYMERGLGIPPVEFSKLMDAASPAGIKQPVKELLQAKMETPEAGLGPQVPILDDFISTELGRHAQNFGHVERPDLLDDQETRKRLNSIFRSCRLS